jgi:hypothetical protein
VCISHFPHACYMSHIGPTKLFIENVLISWLGQLDNDFSTVDYFHIFLFI